VKKREDGVWADDIEIKALEEMTDRLILIYKMEDLNCEPIWANDDEKEMMKDVQPIILSYDGRHYNSLVNTNSFPLKARKSQILLDSRCRFF
jgi:hypothetical protein